jgi:hypothetical protein
MAFTERRKYVSLLYTGMNKYAKRETKTQITVVKCLKEQAP